MNRRFNRRASVALFALFLGAGVTARAQTTTTWTGLGTDALWSDAANWNPIIPASGDTAVFQDAGNGVNSVDLGGVTQQLNILSFTGSPASYTLGVSAGDQLNLTATTGAITLSNTVSSPQTIKANVSTAGAAAITNSGSSSLTVNGSLALGGQMTITGAAGNTTTLNGQITGSGVLNIKGGGTVYVNNGTNTNSGNSNVTGTGTVGSGGTVAGTGLVTGGTLTISSNTAASQGGMVSPGSAPNTAGTLSTAKNMAWDPNGRYVFDYNGSNTAAGGGVNDLMSIATALNLANLGSGKGTFDIHLDPIASTAASGPQTYTIAKFASVSGAVAGGDVTADFTFSGSFDSSVAPTAAISSDGTSLQVTFVPVTAPEPGCLALVGLVGLGAFRRRR